MWWPGTRVSSSYFINTVTRMISECAVLPEGDSGDDRTSGAAYNSKFRPFGCKAYMHLTKTRREADDPGCEDPYQPGGNHHDSVGDTGDSDVIAGLPIPEGCLHTCPVQDQND